MHDKREFWEIENMMTLQIWNMRSFENVGLDNHRRFLNLAEIRQPLLNLNLKMMDRIRRPLPNLNPTEIRRPLLNLNLKMIDRIRRPLLNLNPIEIRRPLPNLNLEMMDRIRWPLSNLNLVEITTAEFEPQNDG